MTSIRLLSGVLIVLFVMVTNIVVAFVQTGIESGQSEADGYDSGTGECAENEEHWWEHVLGDTETLECGTSFLSNLADVTFTGFQGAPDIVNTLWLTIIGLLFATGILLVVLGLAPTTSA